MQAKFARSSRGLEALSSPALGNSQFSSRMGDLEESDSEVATSMVSASTNVISGLDVSGSVSQG